MARLTFTSESVAEGHPDKVCDQISDAILDACLKEDPLSRVAIETLCKSDLCIIAGELTTKASIDFDKIARETIEEIGYSDPNISFNSQNVQIMTYITHQSEDISMGVTEGEGESKEQGAGDQGLMFGFACNQTEELMPLPIVLAHRLVKRLAELRKSGKAPFLKPDAKSQVSVVYENDRAIEISAVVVSSQHDDTVSLTDLRDYIDNYVIKEVIPASMLSSETRFLINPTGRFLLGGPEADCGLTGRKIIMDTYGGYSRHGGGAFSGKDATKVDRSASYAARYIAKNIVASGLADKCEVQLSYAIGIADPVSIYVNTYGTGKIPDSKFEEIIREIFPIKPKDIITALGLRAPIFLPTATYGHFGREPREQFFPWEKTDKAQDLINLI